ncbi:hypothetical protein ILUMI_00833 [Ignelater luminosus]|uniref:Uncharacterized protein n=1 Tax=Ignelater luminosus TaxID=2038154 RepID=A0A8K0DL41_IGNLU|nr:hypothetical protein ILUMI_00833 [Ignelater luminosus]
MIKSSNEDVYKIPYDMMTKSGIWPKKNPSFVYKMKTSLNWFFALSLFVILLLQAIDDIGDFAKLSQSLYIMAAMLGYIIKLGTFTFRRNKFLNMINFLKNPIFTFVSEDFEHYLIKNIKRANLTANSFKYLYMSCVFFYLIYPIADHVSLPFPFPYDLGRYTFLMYAFQMVAESFAAWNNACLDSLCACTMCVAIAQLEILAKKINTVKQNHSSLVAYEISEDVILRRLKHCTKHHLAIIKYIQYIEEIFNIGVFLQLMASVLIICNTLFRFMLVSKVFILNLYFVPCAFQLRIQYFEQIF